MDDTDEFFSLVGSQDVVPEYWLCGKIVNAHVANSGCNVVLTNDRTQKTNELTCPIDGCSNKFTVCICERGIMINNNLKVCIDIPGIRCQHIHGEDNE